MSQIKPALMLECHICHWRPPEDMTMQVAAMHFQYDHDTEEIRMDLSAVCTCGETMTLTETRPTGGGFKDWFCCGVCGNIGWIGREKE